MAKKVEKSESVVVDVDTDVTSVSSVTKVVNDGEQCVDVVVDEPSKKRKTKSKKVADVALEVQLADMEKALESAKNAIESAAADNERMADELGVAVVENKSLRKELSKCKQDFKKVQADNRANSALVETLNGELTRLKVRNDELMETIGRLQDKIKQYADELTGKETEIGTLTFERDCLAAELDGYKSMSLWQRIKFVFLKEGVFKVNK